MVLGLLVGLHEVVMLMLTEMYWGNDFGQYWAGANSIAVGRNPYYWLADGPPSHVFSYVYPPLLAFLLAPLTRLLDFETAHLLWLGFSVLCLAGGVAVVWRLTAVLGERLNAPVLLAAVLLLPSATWALGVGQVSPQLLLLTMGAYAALRRRGQGTAGVLIAVGAGIKSFPVLLGGYFLLRRQWRACGAALVGGGLLLVLTVVALGWNLHWTYLTQVVPSQRWWFTWQYNMSFTGFFARLAADPPPMLVGLDAPFEPIAVALCTVVVLAGSAYAIWRAPADELGARTAYALAILGAMLVSPINGNYNLLLLLLPLSLAIGASMASPVGARIGLGLVVGLLSLPVELCGEGLEWTCVMLNGPLLGQLLLWGWLVYRGCRAPWTRVGAGGLGPGARVRSATLEHRLR